MSDTPRIRFAPGTRVSMPRVEIVRRRGNIIPVQTGGRRFGAVTGGGLGATILVRWDDGTTGRYGSHQLAIETDALGDVQTELAKIGVRTARIDGDGLNVWATPADRYPATTVWFHHSKTNGDGFTWGDRYQYGAPSTVEAHMVAAAIAESLSP